MHTLPSCFKHIQQNEEKFSDTLLVKEGFAATTNSGGAGKWRTEVNEFFKNKQVVIIPDNDPVGRAHAESVARNLHPVAASVKVIDLAGLTPKGDVSDWLDLGHTKADLESLITNTSAWTPSASSLSLLEQIPSIWRVDAPPVEWAVEGLVALGCVTLLSGVPDVGKTWLVLDMSKCILQPRMFLGRRCLRRKVIYSDLENPACVIKQRLEDLGFAEDRDFHFWSFHCPTAPPQLIDAVPYSRTYVRLPTRSGTE